ncbi:hypothetical protein MMC24_002185 [Lignoscripta atroalba]|nr:hypothetical protein [Lignoscripta atroalba]
MARPQEAPLPTFITQQYFDDAMSEQTAMIRQFINPRFLNPGHPVDQTSRGEGTRLFQDMGTQTETDNELGLAQPLEAISHGTWIRRGIQRGKGKGDDAV